MLCVWKIIWLFTGPLKQPFQTCLDTQQSNQEISGVKGMLQAATCLPTVMLTPCCQHFHGFNTSAEQKQVLFYMAVSHTHKHEYCTCAHRRSDRSVDLSFYVFHCSEAWKPHFLSEILFLFFILFLSSLKTHMFKIKERANFMVFYWQFFMYWSLKVAFLPL